MALKLGTKGYLYSKWRDRFEVQEGYCIPSNYTYHNWLGRFVIRYGHKEKHFQCALEPGVVYNQALWLIERDDKLARKLFIEKEETAIRELKEKIERHEHTIRMLQAEVNECIDPVR